MTSYSLRGFSLLELSVVLTVIALMMAGLLSFVTQQTNASKAAELEQKLNAIETALLNFRKANDRLPCPADGSLVMSSANFGKEGLNAGACTTGSTYSANIRTASAGTPTVNFYNSTYVNTVGGVVPTRALGLPDDYMFDPWGGRFDYIADARLTATGAFTTYGPNSSAVGSITIKPSTAGTSLTTQAVALILSHGRNGHGAFQLSGTRKNVGSSNVDEQTNCHCTATSMTATAFTSTFVQKLNTDAMVDGGFDDIVRFYTRSSFVTDKEVMGDR